LARDLDLCKDVDLLLNVHATADSIWPCPACKHSLDKSVVEGKLIVMMQKSMASNALQDLRCQRCNAIKATSLSQLCDCSGAYKLEKTVADHWKKIRTVREVAAYYHLEMALEFAEDCLRFV
jgi:DNA polymerase epsilon subunit 1